MARIPDEVIERLKQEVAVERLIAARGVELKRHGADLFGLCPFHDDHNPSLIVTPAKNVWRCAGKCNMGGSVIDWVMKAEGVSFRHAVELLRAQRSLTDGIRSLTGGLNTSVSLRSDGLFLDQCDFPPVYGFGGLAKTVWSKAEFSAGSEFTCSALNGHPARCFRYQ